MERVIQRRLTAGRSPKERFFRNTLTKDSRNASVIAAFLSSAHNSRAPGQNFTPNHVARSGEASRKENLWLTVTFFVSH